MTNTLCYQAGKEERWKDREKCFILQKHIFWSQIKNCGGVRPSNFAGHVENKFPIKYNARRDSERVRASFGCESCFSGASQARLASRLSPPVVLSALETSTPGCCGGFWCLVGVAGVVYKAQSPRDPTCSAVLHTGTTGSHGERRLWYNLGPKMIGAVKYQQISSNICFSSSFGFLKILLSTNTAHWDCYQIK